MSFPALHPPFTAAMIIPTGVGASIGGFAGDAMPYLNLLAGVTDILITHPNVANAAVFQKLPDNALYVEGYGLDRFMEGAWALQPVRNNRIGVVFDAGIDSRVLTVQLNTLNAVRAVYGVDVVGYALTEARVHVACQIDESGCSSGGLGNPGVILSACRELQAQGAEAIALCVLLPELDEGEAQNEADYRNGTGVDAIGGIEGILSHLVVSELGMPCAHAPVFAWEQSQPLADEVVDPRAAAEYIAPTFLPCILTGLHHAPRFVPLTGKTAPKPGQLTISDLNALVVPVDALGGLPVLSALSRNIPVIAVENNQTVLDVGPDCFDALPALRRDLIRLARSYEEAAGMLQMMRLGLKGRPETHPGINPRSGIPAVNPII